MTRLAGYQTRDARSNSLEEFITQSDIMMESYADAAASLLSLRAEDVGWIPLNRLDKEDGFELEALQEIAQHAELQATGNPLLKRGFTLRRDNVFGRGVSFEGKIPPRFKEILEDPDNYEVLFSEGAFERNERSAFICGNLLMCYDTEDNTFFPIAFDEVSNFASDPNQKSKVHYYERSYVKIDPVTNRPQSEPTVEWYPVLERWEKRGTKPLLTTIANHPVIGTKLIIDFKVNTVNGHVWGVPDCLPAMPYAWAHAEYIRDASKVLKALATIIWKVVAKSKANTLNAAAKIAKPKQMASTAAMTEGTDLVSMPKAGQVDMKDGFSILAYVASALEVSAVALSSDSGASSGSNGAEVTLDGPSANAARARQNLWTSFYKRIYRAVGVKDITVQWPKIQEEPVYRQVQGFQIGFAYGGLHQDEYRAAVLEALDITPLHVGVPEPSPFTTAAIYSMEAEKLNAEKAQQDAAARAAGNVQGQGVSKPAGAALGSDNTNRDASRTPGTGS